MRFFSLAKLIDLQPGYRKVFKIDQHHFLLIEVAGHYHLLESVCPHRGHPLAESDLIAGGLRCPLHGYEFALPSGKPTRMTEEPCRGLKSFELIYQEKDIGVVL